ncbi:50S ribosomal protein L35ae [Candidatus Woesearchaeota archaeon]|nr:50S ribosomal protein L35ae [Candidatus Woesearchaeota archaeon]
MMAVIVNFRGSRRRKSGNQMILTINDVTTKESAQKLVGKKVVWNCPGKEKKTINGKISSAHGNSGCVRVIFERGMPGQSLGTEVKVE